MNLITRLVGLNLFLLLFWYASLGGDSSIYIDIPNIFFVMGVLIAGALLCFPLGQLRDAFSAAIFTDNAPPVSAWQRQMRIAVFARLYQLAWGGGLLSALLALIAMLSDLSVPASIGAGMAVALTGPVYGAMLAEFVFNPMQQMVMNQPPSPDGGGQGEQPASPVPSGQSGMWKGVAVVAVIIAAFMVPIVSFSEIKKEDALAPEVEATYLRYLYGDAAPESAAVSLRLQASIEQRDLERRVVFARLHELMPDRDAAWVNEAADMVLSIPQDETIEPSRSHLWRLHLTDRLFLQSGDEDRSEELSLVE